MRYYEIKVQNVGQCFGCMATVSINGRRVYETRTFPYGNRGAAYTNAENWLKDNAARLGVTVREDDGVSR